MIDPFLAAATDLEVKSMIELVNQAFHEMPDKVSRLQQSLGAGLQKTIVDPWSDMEVEQAYATGYALFQAQQYDAALPVALHLALNRPLDPRFMFMAGMILQSLGDPLLAATFFATQLIADPQCVPAAFRLAECYAAIGQEKEARDIFEIAIDMGRDSLGDPDEFFSLQSLIVEKLGSLN